MERQDLKWNDKTLNGTTDLKGFYGRNLRHNTRHNLVFMLSVHLGIFDVFSLPKNVLRVEAHFIRRHGTVITRWKRPFIITRHYNPSIMPPTTATF
jgi:hypothetical protein